MDSSCWTGWTVTTSDGGPDVVTVLRRRVVGADGLSPTLQRPGPTPRRRAESAPGHRGWNVVFTRAGICGVVPSVRLRPPHHHPSPRGGRGANANNATTADLNSPPVPNCESRTKIRCVGIKYPEQHKPTLCVSFQSESKSHGPLRFDSSHFSNFTNISVYVYGPPTSD